MHEVFAESIRWVNLPFTALLGLVVLYWLLVALGALDINLFGDADAEVHLHGHGDVHADADVGGDHPLVHGDPHLPGDKAGGFEKSISGDSGASWWVQTLGFLNVGEVPVMVVVSTISLCLWLGSIIANRYITGGAPLLALAALIPNLVAAVIVTRYVTLPFKPIFRALTRDYDAKVEIIGQRCRITTTEATPDFGQAEIQTHGAPVLLNVRTMADARLSRGQTAVVVREERDRGFYLVTPLPDAPSSNHTR